MAISGLQTIQVGLQNESTGSDSLYTAFTKTRDNFDILANTASPFNTFASGTGINANANTTTNTVTITNIGVTSIIAGNNITVDSSNGNVTISSTISNSTASGSNTQIQFNDAGILSGNTNFTFNKTTGIFSALYLAGNGNGLSNIQGANVSGAVTYATTANSVAGANVSGAVTYATTANAVAGANVSGAVTYATTANAVAGANVSGQVGNSLIAGTVYTAAQPNITSVGTLSSLSVSGNITAGNANVSGNINANYIIGNGSQLTNLPAPTITEANTSPEVFVMVTDGNLKYTGHVTIQPVTGDIFTSGNISLVNIVSANTLTGNLSTANQPNITSVGTLTSLSVSGNIAGGNINVSNGRSNVTGTANVVGGGATVGVRSILAIDSAFGSNDANDPASAQAVRGRVTGSNLTKTRNYVAGVTGQYLVTGTNASEFINTGLLGVVGDQTTTANAAVVAYLDGDGGLTTAGSAYGVSMKNSTPGSGFDYGLDLQFIDLNVAGTTTPFKQADIRFNNGVELVANVANTISIGANLTVTGNANIGNIGTTGVVSVTGNISGGNLILTTGNIIYTPRYGSFYSNATQTNPVANTAMAMTFNNTNSANGVSVVSNSRLTVAKAGTYNIQFSAQFTKTDAGTDYMEVWLSKNGTSVPWTNTRLRLVGSNVYEVASWNFVETLGATEYVQLMWGSADLNAQIVAIPSANTTMGIDVPSVIVTVTPVGA